MDGDSPTYGNTNNNNKNNIIINNNNNDNIYIYVRLGFDTSPFWCIIIYNWILGLPISSTEKFSAEQFQTVGWLFWEFHVINRWSNMILGTVQDIIDVLLLFLG